MNKKQKRANRRAEKRRLKRPHFIMTQTRTETGRRVTFIQSSELVGSLDNVKLII